MKNSAKHDYFNTDNDKRTNEQPEQKNYTKVWAYFSGVTSILSLISLIILIMLNITSLVKTYQAEDNDATCLRYFSHVADSVKDINEVISADIQPKVSLITSATSYTIPSMVDNLGDVLTNEITTKCSSLVLNQSCTVENPKMNDMRFSLLNTKATDACIKDKGEIKIPEDVEFINFPSFIPGSTIPDSCTRYPSFALSGTNFAYTHSLYPVSCDHGIPISQTWLLGYIGNSPNDQPEPRTIISWNMDSTTKRSSCSPAVGNGYGWLGCTEQKVLLSEEMKGNTVSPILISYMDTRGRKREWTLEYKYIDTDQDWAFLKFGVGSGVIIDGYVHFLVYGALLKDSTSDVYCQSIGCQNHNQRDCNTAAHIPETGGRILVNGILSFLDDPNIRPSIKLQVIPQGLNWQGGPGRLMYDRSSDKLYVYIKSSGWNPYLQIGFIYYIFPLNITWVPYTSLTRPGEGYCGSTSRCPKKCFSGSYNDAFPLTSDLQLVVSCILNSSNFFVDPTVVSATPTQITGKKRIFHSNTVSGETTTTCFMYDGFIWCLSLVENSNLVNFNMKVTPFLYRLVTRCPSETWWTVAQNNGYMKYLTPYIPSKVTEMLKSRKTEPSLYSRLPRDKYLNSTE